MNGTSLARQALAGNPADPCNNVTPVLNLQAPGRPERRERGMVCGIAPDELPRLAPKLKHYLRRPDPTWPELVDAAGEWLRHELGVSKSLWGDACLRMGRELAAVALVIVSTKPEGYFTSGAGGYFHGMVAKHVAGELRLERTVWALRRELDPERYATRPRNSRHDAHLPAPPNSWPMLPPPQAGE